MPIDLSKDGERPKVEAADGPDRNDGSVQLVRDTSIDTTSDAGFAQHLWDSYRHTPPPGSIPLIASPARWATYGSGMWKPGGVGLGLGIGSDVKLQNGVEKGDGIFEGSEEWEDVGVERVSHDGGGDEDVDAEVTLKPQRRETLVLWQEMGRENGGGDRESVQTFIRHGSVHEDGDGDGRFDLAPKRGLKRLQADIFGALDSMALSRNDHATTMPFPIPFSYDRNDLQDQNGRSQNQHALTRMPHFPSFTPHNRSFHTTPADTDSERDDDDTPRNGTPRVDGEEDPYGPVIGRLERDVYGRIWECIEGMKAEIRMLRNEVRELKEERRR
ncbi:hypothetical protein HK097_006679, partial [Rhizophlyctis rosea]